MEKETSYIEKLLKNIAVDKNRMWALIFSVLSAICSLLYVATSGSSGIHFIFMLAMIGAAVTIVVYASDAEAKFKHGENCVFYGIAAMFIGLLLKVIRVGISFSIEYLIGYLVYAVAFLMMCLYCAKNEAKPKIIKILLLVCAAWSIFEFIALSSTFIVGITWKIFRLSEAFLAIGCFCLLNMIEKAEIPFAEKIGNYKKQIPSFKICIAILLIVAIVSGVIGFVLDMNKGSVSTVKNKTVTQEKTVTEESKKSTVQSTVVPADEKTAEVEEIKLGDSVETDSFTLKLNKVEIMRRVEPDNPPSYYTYYQAEADHTYIYVNASVTNKEKYSLECDEIYSVTADFDGGYEYKGFNIADDNDGDFTYANITSVEPLETRGVHCLVDCPQVVEEEGKPLFITISLKNGSKYKYIIK